MPLRDTNPPHATGRRAVLCGDEAEAAAPTIRCSACDSTDVVAAWTGAGELRTALCRAPGCGWRWMRSSGASDVHPLARLAAELSPDFSGQGLI